MPTDDVPRSIRFPRSLWDAIDADAQRCKRSAVKQLEALLATFYGLEDVEIDKRRLLGLRSNVAEVSIAPRIETDANLSDETKAGAEHMIDHVPISANEIIETTPGVGRIQRRVRANVK